MRPDPLVFTRVTVIRGRRGGFGNNLEPHRGLTR
jgi:hypothetical protein